MQSSCYLCSKQITINTSIQFWLRIYKLIHGLNVFIYFSKHKEKQKPQVSPVCSATNLNTVQNCSDMVSHLYRLFSFSNQFHSEVPRQFCSQYPKALKLAYMPLPFPSSLQLLHGLLSAYVTSDYPKAVAALSQSPDICPQLNWCRQTIPFSHFQSLSLFLYMTHGYFSGSCRL